MIALVAGMDDYGIADALAAAGATVRRVDVANRPSLEDAGIHEAGLFVLAEVGQATTIPVARDLATDLRIVVYADRSLPDFARGQADLVIDPALLDPETVATELVE